MAERPWDLFTNRFESSTRGNYPKAIAVGTQHMNSLFADSTTIPIALTCYNLIKPLVAALTTAHLNYSSQSGNQGGTVISFTAILKGMSATVDGWQTSIKVVYPVTSARYQALFPKGKSVFTSGKQQARMDAVGTLITNIGSDASLATVKTTITTFYTAMQAAFVTKGTSKSTTKTDSSAVEAARIGMVNMMLSDYGSLINFYNATPLVPSKYFDETLLRNTLQLIFDTTVSMLKTKNIFKRTFANPTPQQLQVTNSTNTTAQMFLSVTKLGQVGLVFVTIGPLTTTTYSLTDFGDPTTATYLNIYNTDTKIKAQVTVKLL